MISFILLIKIFKLKWNILYSRTENRKYIFHFKNNHFTFKVHPPMLCYIFIALTCSCQQLQSSEVEPYFDQLVQPL